MGVLEKIKALINGDEGAGDGPTFSAEVGLALEAENARLRAEVERLKAGATIKFAGDVSVDPRTELEASRMVEDLVREGRCVPAAREKAVALFTACLHDDTVNKKLTFTAGRIEGRLTTLLRDTFAAIPPVTGFDPGKAGGEVHVFAHGDGKGGDTAVKKIDAAAYLKAASGGAN